MEKIPEETYKKILELVPICCVDLVIVYNDKICILKRTNEPAKGEWFLPRGRVLKNEHLENAALRKAKEETGLDTKIIKPLIFEETIFEEPSMEGVQSGAHTVNVSFLLKAEDNNVSLDTQNSEYKWVDKNDEDWHPYVKKVINASGVFN